MATQPLVSVHMLAYRHGRFIAEAIEGVVGQLCDFPIELIIAEDHSPDNTLSIALDYQSRYPHLIRIITGDHNVGMHANSARGMNAIRGQYAAFCEGDDYWHNPKKLQLQVEAMMASPNVTLCHTEYDRRIGLRVKHDRHHAAHAKVAEGDAYANLLREWTIMTATSLYPTRVIEQFRRTPFCNLDWPFGDYNLALYASTKGRVAYLPISTATWRRVTGSASNCGPDKALEMHTAATECRRTFMQAIPIDEQQELTVEEGIHRKFMRLAFLANRPDIYQQSYNWLKERGLESDSIKHQLRKAAMSARFPITAISKTRTVLRAIAAYQV